jgi:hypothetical protein
MNDAERVSPSPEPRVEVIDAPADYPFPKRAENLAPWTSVEVRLGAAKNYWLATSRPDGRPHVAPLWGAWIDNALYFEGYPTSRWARNLARNPAASINLEDGSDVVIVEGIVDFVLTDAALAARIVSDWRAKYGKLEPEPESRGLYRLRPRTARAWTESLEDGARWVFPDS